MVDTELRSALVALRKAFITIGTMLFVIVAFRNSLVWYVAKVWSSSHDFWSYLWAAVFRASGESDFIMTVVCESPSAANSANDFTLTFGDLSTARSRED